MLTGREPLSPELQQIFIASAVAEAEKQARIIRQNIAARASDNCSIGAASELKPWQRTSVYREYDALRTRKIYGDYPLGLPYREGARLTALEAQMSRYRQEDLLREHGYGTAFVIFAQIGAPGGGFDQFTSALMVPAVGAARPQGRRVNIHMPSQLKHVRGTTEYANRIRQGRETSYFANRTFANLATRITCELGKPVKGKPQVVEFNFGFPIGFNQHGQPQTKVRVHTKLSTGEVHGTPHGPPVPSQTMY